ncbi:hypothetical protein EDB89DRAFT_2071334 [Lactarius sanguifluus]|nr:hypothetical protein EDB89DRAFT_2071334 [Lactarius sanguifluus]
MSGSSIVENVLNWANFRAEQQIKNRRYKTQPLSDVNKEGTHTASQRTLILTEGDSAKVLAVASALSDATTLASSRCTEGS